MTQQAAIKLADLPKVQPYSLHPDDRAAIEHDVTHYDDSRAAVIDALKVVQKREGWVPDGALYAIGDVLGIPAADVEGVATFYNLIFRQPVGRHVIKLCDSLSCFLTGADAVREELSRRIGARPGQTSADGRFTLLPIVCLGACDKAPVAMINDDTHTRLTPDGIGPLLESYR
jgi:NADH dehydrogenase subunit E (EC 1.6.5.3)